MNEEYMEDRVPVKYQKRYGKTYDSKEIKSFAYAVAKSKKIRIDK